MPRSEMTVMSRMVKERLETPLNECGAQGCSRQVDSVGAELKQCSRQVTSWPSASAETLIICDCLCRCKSAVYVRWYSYSRSMTDHLLSAGQRTRGNTGRITKGYAIPQPSDYPQGYPECSGIRVAFSVLVVLRAMRLSCPATSTAWTSVNC
jgi:hypothetical protein